MKLINDQGKEVKLGEEGELCFRGPGTSSGYYKDLELTKKIWGAIGKDGWFKTGDLARINPDGNITITGRKKDVIVRGGQNIYPAEIESLLLLHPSVKQAAVVPMADPIMGEKACAYVALHDAKKLTFNEMVSFLKSKKIAPYKIPERLEILEELPARGQKISKVELCDDIVEKIKQEKKI
jgi:non-ribosomal peptide synthetase component E (peptide arylation enzyme)